ncbi:zinc finger protein 436-like [Agrilus planipennis]|uniref:Zinc finger protein 436-like n=1 Tax=Agrilus planipennis TaxID=224129 RepID=A0A7F5RGW9_AGRPL|nr:zinc finger protein 436-like [Agrilus planipennis]
MRNTFKNEVSRRRKKHECEICGKEFLYYGRYENHKSLHENGKFQCNSCIFRASNKISIERHHKVTGHNGLSQLQCESFKEEPQQDIINVEQETDDTNTPQSNSTDTVGLKECSEDSKEDSPQDASSKNSCEVCKKIFNHPSSLIYHREAEHNNGQRFVCIKCDKSFKHKQLLQRHQLVHSEERPYRCKQCDASFKTRANLINHMPIHTGEKKYFCSQCGQTFAHKTSLTLHIRWHSGQKPFQCDICLKSFSQKGNLAEHKRIHTGEKPYNCEHCNRKFTTSSQYKLHMKRHSGERPWRCEFCPKTFLHRDTWKCHTRRHKNEKPYQCEQCLKGFTEQCALKKHERLHTGEKPYVCEFCNRGFADCSNLAKHKRIHENEPNLIETPEIKVLTSSKDDENDIFYVTLDPNSSEIQSPSLVQIMEQLDTKNNENDEAHAKINNISTLSTKNNAVIQQIIDQEGNTMSVALPDGQMLRVVTTMENGEQNFKGLTNDGSLIPLNVNFEDERTIFGNEQMNVTLDEKENEFEEWTNKKKDDSKVATIPLIQFLDSDIQILPGQKMENNLQLLVEGQNVCFVTAYNSDDPTNSQYLAMA